MTPKKRKRLIGEAVEAGREFGRNQRPPLEYKTIDLVTGLHGGTAITMLSIPYDPWHWTQTGHIKIDLPAMGYRLVKADKPE